MPTIKLEDLTKPLFGLSDDFERAEKDLLANDDSYSHRNHIRALFAMVEGTIYLLNELFSLRLHPAEANYRLPNLLCFGRKPFI